MKKLITILAVVSLYAIQVCAQISVKGYSLVYSSETPERAASLLNLTDEELANCTGDFSSIENMERNWLYCPRASSKWNKRMAENDGDRAKLHFCENGTLRLLARSFDGTVAGCTTSGIKMKKGYKYGIYEIKAKCNAHKSNFPAIWMMPSVPHGGWPDCGEMDIMEQIGTSNTVWSTVHLGARYDDKVGKSYSWSGSYAASAGWHIYSLRWDKKSLIFYCDGRQVFRYNKDATLDLENHPEYEHAQFPYNEEFYMILDQAVGCNAWWGDEDPDPAYTYEMDVEYVRIFQAPEEEQDLDYYFIQNMEEPAYYMSASDEGLVGITDIDFLNPNPDAVFCFPAMDSGTKKFIRTQSRKYVLTETVTNKIVQLGETGASYNIIRDDEKGVAFDCAKTTYPLTFVDGSRALFLNASKNHIISASGTSKSASWWKVLNVNDVQTNVGGVMDERRDVRAKKVIRDNRLIIQLNGKEYTPTGCRIK